MLELDTMPRDERPGKTPEIYQKSLSFQIAQVALGQFIAAEYHSRPDSKKEPDS